jgi:hypothetical protein
MPAVDKDVVSKHNISGFSLFDVMFDRVCVKKALPHLRSVASIRLGIFSFHVIVEFIRAAKVKASITNKALELPKLHVVPNS